MNSLKVEYRDIDSISGYSENSRTHDADQVKQLASSIQEFGFNNPILVDADGVVIAGHGRLAAAEKLGLEEVPCIELGHLTDEQRRAYVIADNKISDMSGWDEDALARELAALYDKGFDLGLTGFNEKELATMLADAASGGADKDDIPPAPESHQVVTMPGDLWELEGHRLLCGDSTSTEDVAHVMDGQLADMVWTDPPYNVDYEGANGQKIQNDSMDGVSFYCFLLDAFKAACANTKPGGGIYIAHADGEGRNFRGAMVDSGYLFKQCLIWVKNHFTLGRQDYQWQHEPILYGWKPGAAHRWYGNFDKKTVIDDEQAPEFMTQAQLVARIREIREHLDTSVIRADKPRRNAEHPTMKPVELVAKMIKNSSKLGDTVLDLFGGSGSTMIAAEITRRRAMLVELDPVFCDVIVARWQEFTGQPACCSGKTYEELKQERLNSG